MESLNQLSSNIVLIEYGLSEKGYSRVSPNVPYTPIVINRQSSETLEIKGVATIPAGTRIAVDMYRLYFDPELWGPVDPHEFYPERFATKRHSMAWIPFGAGPRNCVGMRFALMELKKYSIIHCETETEKQIKI